MCANVISNIIQFPQKEEKGQTDNLLLKSLETYCDEITSDILVSMTEQDFPVSSEDYIQDISMLFESIRSIAYKSQGLPPSTGNCEHYIFYRHRSTFK
jgi:uncharacterized protein YehS (DUF1456 family)